MLVTVAAEKSVAQNVQVALELLESVSCRVAASDAR